MQIFMYTYISIKDLVQLEQLKYVTTQYDTYFNFSYLFSVLVFFPFRTLIYTILFLLHTLLYIFPTISIKIYVQIVLFFFFNFLCTFIYIVNFKNIIYRKPYNFFRKVSFLQYIT